MRTLHHPSPAEETTALEAVLYTHIPSHLVRSALAASLVLALSPAYAMPALAQTTSGTGASTEAALATDTPETLEEVTDAYRERLEETRAAEAERSAAQAAEQAKREFVDEWAPRIDAYLEGSPLEGCGATFAEAAYTYDVDPRWSPAISCIESSKGAHCFRSHNAWGWGNVSWDSWEEAIWAHVRGLAEGYGSTITPEAAAKYCPPSHQSWYANVSSEMERI